MISHSFQLYGLPHPKVLFFKIIRSLSFHCFSLFSSLFITREYLSFNLFMHVGRQCSGMECCNFSTLDLKSGKNNIDLLCMTLGLQVCGIPKRDIRLRLLIMYHKRLKKFLVEFPLKT